MMNKLYDILETCLHELENGANLDAVLGRHPEHAKELRPILKASLQARRMTAPAPSADVTRRNRAKLMQRAAEMREAKASTRKRVIPIFQRFAISFALVALFLTSGTGLVSASSNALPGENLYPVKRTWENVRLFFVFDRQARSFLETQFELERLEEVSGLLKDGRNETIQYSGVFTLVNGKTYISGIQVILPAVIQLPLDGSAVFVTGHTNPQGFVEVESLELLPDGAIVPLGQPVEVENEAEASPSSNSGSGSNSGTTGSGSDNQSQEDNSNRDSISAPPSAEVKGTVDSVSNAGIVVNGQSLLLNGSENNVVVRPGDKVEVKGYVDQIGQFIVIEIKVESSDSGSGDSNDSGSNSSSGSGSTSGGSSGSTSGGESTPSSGDDSGSGSGDGSGGSDDSGGGSGSGGGDDD